MEVGMSLGAMAGAILFVVILARIQARIVRGPAPSSRASSTQRDIKASMARHPAGSALRSSRFQQAYATQVERMFAEVERARDDDALIAQARFILRQGL